MNEKCPCGKKATRWVGLNDPDGRQFSKCTKHAEEWKINILCLLAGEPTFTFGRHSKKRKAGKRKRVLVRKTSSNKG